MLGSIRRRLANIFDALDGATVRAWLERLVVTGAAVGFLLHLAVIGIARLFPDLPLTLFEGIDKSPLHAVYTPFSVILFYEVILLVFALAASHTGEVAMQYQIISLIVVRGVFKDIGGFHDLENWIAEPAAVTAVLFDMAGAALMFLIVTGFNLLRHLTPKTPTHRDLEAFVQLKKAVAVLLLVVLVTLALVNLASWARLIEGLPVFLSPPPTDVDLFFFPRFFEFMIFTDVFLLIVSLAYYDRYEHVFRNAAFVISTVLLRVSLSTPKPYDVALALIAMLYGLAILGVFACFAAIQRKWDPAPLPGSGGQKGRKGGNHP